MAIIRNRPNSLTLGKLRPGKHADGDGLYLHVGPGGSRSWIFRYALAGNSREMGLGPYPAISLARAHELHADARWLKAEGIDPRPSGRAARRRHGRGRHGGDVRSGHRAVHRQP
jgi:Arm DNA-binding domain